MKTATIEEFASSTEETLKGSEPVMVLKNGRPIGVFQPLPEPDQSIPLEERRKRYAETSEAIARELEAKGITEEQIDRDIKELLRKGRGRY